MPSPSLPYGKSRNLTPQETALVQRVFGHSINPMSVRIHHGKFIGVQPNSAVMTPKGEIYFPTPLYVDDYSLGHIEARLQHIFIHEITHVWQYQLGYPVMAKGLFESVIGSITGSGYNYKLKPDTKLSDYPMEAQANIIADYAMLVIKNVFFYSGKDYGKPLSNLAELQAQLQVVLSEFINNPSNKMNLPKEAINPYCKVEPNIANCLTR